MKIRLGFVSNSSTSSFMCSVCGEINAERDASLSDFEMFECKNGHTICNDHVVSELKEEFDSLKGGADPDEDVEDDDTEWDDYSVPIKFCPICSLVSLPDAVLLPYILRRFNLKKDDVISDIKKFFKDKKELDAFVDSGISPIPELDKRRIGTRLFRIDE